MKYCGGGGCWDNSISSNTRKTRFCEMSDLFEEHMKYCGGSGCWDYSISSNTWKSMWRNLCDMGLKIMIS